VKTSISFSLDTNVENLTLLGTAALAGTGNALANQITGNTAANSLTGGDDVDTLNGGLGNDTLDGGAGADLMRGGAGNDSYIADDGGDRADEGDPGTGLDSGGIDIVLASAPYTLSTFVENLTLTGIAGIDGTGNALANKIVGNGADNALAGDLGNDTLTGAGGADSLDGGVGTDSMSCGAGNDTYAIDNVGDRAFKTDPGTSTDSSGVDLVNASVSVIMGLFVENLTGRRRAPASTLAP